MLPLGRLLGRDSCYLVSSLFAIKHPSIHHTTYPVWLVAFTRCKERSRVGAVAVLNVNVRHDTRKYFLHWQHSSKLLPSLDLAVVSDGMNTDEFYTVTWKRWERKRGQETSAASALVVCKKSSVLVCYWRLQGRGRNVVKVPMILK